MRFLYWIAAIWLGFLNYFFWASWLVRLSGLVLLLIPKPADPPGVRPLLAGVLYAVAVLAGIYGLVNVRIIRIRRIGVHLPNLPASWCGRRAVLLSDLHLGSINGVRFCRRMAALAASFNPDMIFLPGDLFDGTKGKLDSLLAPFKQLAPPTAFIFLRATTRSFTRPHSILKRSLAPASAFSPMKL